MLTSSDKLLLSKLLNSEIIIKWDDELIGKNSVTPWTIERINISIVRDVLGISDLTTIVFLFENLCKGDVNLSFDCFEKLYNTFKKGYKIRKLLFFFDIILCPLSELIYRGSVRKWL